MLLALIPLQRHCFIPESHNSNISFSHHSTIQSHWTILHLVWLRKLKQSGCDLAFGASCLLFSHFWGTEICKYWNRKYAYCNISIPYPSFSSVWVMGAGTCCNQTVISFQHYIVLLFAFSIARDHMEKPNPAEGLIQHTDLAARLQTGFILNCWENPVGTQNFPLQTETWIRNMYKKNVYKNMNNQVSYDPC